MDKMTDARAVEVLAAMREDGGAVADADYTAAIDHAIARLGEPAEAQAQGGGEVVQEHYEHFLAYSGLSDNVWLRYAYFHGADIGLDRPERPAKVLRFDKRDFDHSIEVYEDGYYVSHDDYLAALYTAPPSAPVGVEAAEAMGARGGPASESERLAFEAWMRGHCWPLCATWDGTGYRSDAEQGGRHCPDAARTRGLWAAWRDRAALAQQPAAEFRNDGNSEADFIAHHADACTACGGSGHKADQQPAAAWQAIVEACVITEAVTPDATDPRGTLHRLIDYHVALDRDQQPAAVDGAEGCVHGCVCGCCRACKNGSCEPVRYAVCDCALAAQPGGSDNDR